MSLIVQKYGGTSVANAERIKHVAKLIVKARDRYDNVVVVVSAMGKTTDNLIKMAAEITDSPSRREMDMLLSTGERISIALITMAIHSLGYDAISFTGSQVEIITDTSHTKARILRIGAKRVREELKKGKIVVIAGFQGVSINNDVTTMGRGASDTSAIAIAAALGADECEVYTDVEGVFTSDPRVIPQAKKIKSITYEEMLEMASLGAKVMAPRSMQIAQRFKVPLHIRSSFINKTGTVVVSKERGKMEEALVRSVILNEDEAKISIIGIPDKPGIAGTIFNNIADENINVDMIIQNISAKGVADISFTVAKEDIKRTLDVTDKLKSTVNPKKIECDKNIAKISIVGIGMRTHAGVAAKMFQILGKNKINIRTISTSEIKISCLVDKKEGKKAARVLHKAFELDKTR
ncbi:MAG: aspartate kinase [bacterium]|nr:aspartate kinase [bacterium]